ncbi:MAG: diadenylate cyclase CdaA [Bacteroidota bacterium]
MIDLFVKIGFLPITIWDILDILIVGFIIYQVFRLLRGSIAFNIFIGLILIYVLSALVQLLHMDLLATIMSQFANVGVLALLIVFQPEVRRFLIVLGTNTLKGRINFLKRIFNKSWDDPLGMENQIRDVIRAVENFSKSKTGALMVFTTNPNLQSAESSGVKLNADISSALLETIFHKESPLHDGAVIISEGKIIAASCILPVSDNSELPKRAGLRHRAGVGITEGTEAMAVIVSEQTGKISVARDGKLNSNLTPDQLDKYLRIIFSQFYPDT